MVWASFVPRIGLRSLAQSREEFSVGLAIEATTGHTRELAALKAS
jgi:hypothetical protein